MLGRGHEMENARCTKCGSGALLTSFISVRCPLCGKTYFFGNADVKGLWSEHRLGLMYRKDGWRLADEVEAPAWFIEQVA
jgi:hypothetical protein